MNTETVTPKVKTGRKVKWPLLSLSVGESLTVPLCDGPAQKISPILSATARRNPEFRFKQKKTDGGYVITRVELKPEIASDSPALRESALDELTAETERLGLYVPKDISCDNPDKEWCQQISGGDGYHPSIND